LGHDRPRATRIYAASIPTVADTPAHVVKFGLSRLDSAWSSEADFRCLLTGLERRTGCGVFEAASEEALTEACRRAEVGSPRIVPALE